MNFTCCTCGETKSGSEFYWRKNGRRYSDCKVCHLARSRREYQRRIRRHLQQRMAI